MLLTKLPIEIFQDIGSYLDAKDITTCQTVCKSWYKRWITFNYYSIQTRGRLQFHNFFYHTLKNSLYPQGTEFSIGHQIRKLFIENGHIEPSVLGQLPILCPYLEVFMFDGVILSEEARRERFQYYQQRKNREELNKIRHNFVHWKNMRQIVEFNGITVAHSLLNNAIFFEQMKCYSQLTHISVQFNNSNDRTNSKASFIDSLTNAPLLESLSIERIYLSVIELEKIHDNCPKLCSLCLINTLLLPMSEGFYVEDVIPARNLHDLQFSDGSFCDDVPRWLDYISKKYVNVKILDIGNCSFTSEDDNGGKLSSMKRFHLSYEKQLLQIAKSFIKLEVLKLLSFSLGNQFFDILDQKGTFLKELTLGDGLSTVLLANELAKLIQSRQRHSISLLKVHGWPLSAAMHGTLLIMETIHQCTNLTTLNLSMGRYLHYQNNNTTMSNNPSDSNIVDNGTLYFDFILEQCPKLISLTVTDAKLITTSDSDNSMAFFSPSRPTTIFPLQSLKLENVLFETTSIFDIIRSRCLALSQLSLTSTVPNPKHMNSRHLKIYLPHHRLKTLVLDRIRVSRKCSIRLGASRFKITSSMKTTWYDLVGYECCMSHFPASITNRISSKYHPSMSSSDTTTMMLSEKMRARKVRVTHDTDYSLDYNLDQSVYVTVVCKDVESIYLTGYQVL